MPDAVHLNADLGAFARVDTAALDWQKSPVAGVWRKRVYLDGAAEAGRVTSVVRYDPGASFSAHGHPDGEEILVLDGVFSDDSGDYGAGHHLLNPEGFSHAPRTGPGCTLFVKLRQYAGPKHIQHDTDAMAWQPARHNGVAAKLLDENGDGSIVRRLVKIDPGCQLPAHDHPGGEEIFILSGDLADAKASSGAGTWIRYPPGSRHGFTSRGGCVFYAQSGGFGEG